MDHKGGSPPQKKPGGRLGGLRVLRGTLEMGGRGLLPES